MSRRPGVRKTGGRQARNEEAAAEEAEERARARGPAPALLLAVGEAWERRPGRPSSRGPGDAVAWKA